MESKVKKLISIERSSDFLRIKKAGFRFKSCDWVLICYISNTSDKCRFGWTISRRVGNAVIRNKLKRWCREYFRNFLMEMNVVSGLDINVIFRPITKEFYKEISRAEFELQLDKFSKRVLSKSVRHN